MQPNTKSPKYHQILQTARNLFWKHGISRVTVDEICTEAAVSKMTFYRMFDNKIELAKTVLDHLFEESFQKYRKMMAQDIPFTEKIRQIVHLKFEGTQQISQELLLDIYKNQEPALKAYIENWKQRSLNQFLNDLAEAQRKGWLRKDIQPAFVLYLLNKMTDFVTDEKLLALYQTPQGLIMEVTNFFFYGISPNDANS